MKKAFSLIEIMQTIILLGIIAGLSISFFKKMNTDDKLLKSTEEKLQVAIEEVNRQMCSDDTPTCKNIAPPPDEGEVLVPYDDTMINKDGNCRQVYSNDPGVVYDEASKYCVKRGVAVDVPCPSITAAYAARDYAPMVKDANGMCYAVPPCDNNINVIPGTEESTYRSVPISSVICENNIPQYQKDRDSVTAFCYYLHSVLMHKPQGVDIGNDRLRSCAKDDNSTTFRNNTDPMTTAIINWQADPAYSATHGRDNYSMLLPNGVYLYNIGNKDFPINIYIKYDREQAVKSAKYIPGDTKKSTIAVMRVKNPAVVHAAPPPP